MRSGLLLSASLTTMLALGGSILPGCEAAIEKYNPTDPRFGIRQYPTPPTGPLAERTRARNPQIEMQVREQFKPDGRILLTNRSPDGAVYGVRLTVNNDFHCTVGLIEMGQTVRVPDSMLQTDQGQSFGAAGVSVQRAEARHEGRVIAVFEPQPKPPSRR